MTLTKAQAIEMFGSRKALREALGLTNSRISQWPNQLDQDTTDRVIGAALRVGRPLPLGYAASDDVQPPAGISTRKTKKSKA